jgi:hypothetical protein
MFRAPTQAGLPPFSLMLRDVPFGVAQVARHLGVTVPTVERYAKTESAPRPVMLALFWETRWGRSAADVEANNWGAVYYRLAKSLERENAILKRQMAELEAAAAAGDAAANAPYIQAGSLARKVWHEPLHLFRVQGLPRF